MSIGFFALLDDIAMIARSAAAAVDDVASLTAKATGKTAGIVIDDAAVAPTFVTGLPAARELPIVLRIAAGSLRNKILVLLPAFLILTALLPWVVTPILLCGAIYLCFEGAEKIWHGKKSDDTGAAPRDPEKLEECRTEGAIRTDFILSAEIMAITLSTVVSEPIWIKAIVLVVVAIVTTVAVYGAVAVIVKADDLGLRLAADEERSDLVRGVGRNIVVFMPQVLQALTIVGTAAMIWVGGGIIVHGLATFGYAGYEHAIEAQTHDAHWFAGFLLEAAAFGVVGIVVGTAAIGAKQQIDRLRTAAKQSS